MKQVTVYRLAFLLVVGTTAALAGDRGHGGYSGGHHYRHGGHHNNHYRPYRHDGYYGRHDSSYAEVTGCHRIECLADGSERRIEVPLSQCQ